MRNFALTGETRVTRCPNCGLHDVILRITKSVPGKHYHCNNCGHEWQDRVVRRYRQRKTRYDQLLKMVFEQIGQLDSQDRFFIEKLLKKGNYGLKTHARLIRIAHKAGIDPREPK